MRLCITKPFRSQMTERKGMFAVFADDDEDNTTTITKAAPKKAAEPKPKKVEDRPATAKPRGPVDNTGFDNVVG